MINLTKLTSIHYKKVGLGVLYSGSGSCLAIFINLYYSRVLSVEEYGNYFITLAYSAALSCIYTFGLDVAISKAISNLDEQTLGVISLFAVLKKVIFIPCLLLFLSLICLIVFWAVGLTNISFLIAIICHSLTTYLLRLISAYNIGIGKYELTGFTQSFLPRIILLFILVILSIIKRPIDNSIHVIFLISLSEIFTVLGCIAINFRGKISKATNTIESLVIVRPKLMFNYFVADFSANVLCAQMPFIYFGLVQNYRLSAVVGLATRFLMPVKLITKTSFKSVDTYCASLFRDGEHVRLKKIYQKIVKNTLIVALILLIPIWLTSPLLMSFGGTYYKSYWSVIIILSAYEIVNILTGPAGRYLSLTQYSSLLLKSSAFGIINSLVGLIVCYIFFKQQIYFTCFVLMILQSQRKWLIFRQAWPKINQLSSLSVH